MRVYNDVNRSGIITIPKTFHFDLPKHVGNSLKLEIDSSIKHNDFLEISQLLSVCNHGSDFYQHGKQ